MGDRDRVVGGEAVELAPIERDLDAELVERRRGDGGARLDRRHQQRQRVAHPLRPLHLLDRGRWDEVAVDLAVVGDRHGAALVDGLAQNLGQVVLQTAVADALRIDWGRHRKCTIPVRWVHICGYICGDVLDLCVHVGQGAGAGVVAPLS